MMATLYPLNQAQSYETQENLKKKKKKNILNSTCAIHPKGQIKKIVEKI